MKKILSALAVSALLVGGLSACSNDDQAQADPQYARVCVDQNQNRVPADECAQNTSSGSDAFLWWYVLYGSTLPRYGYHVNGGYSHISSSASYARAERAPAGKAYSKPGSSVFKKITSKIPTIKKAPVQQGPAKKPVTGSGSGSGFKPAAPKAPAVKPVAPRPAAPRPAAPRR